MSTNSCYSASGSYIVSETKKKFCVVHTAEEQSIPCYCKLLAYVRMFGGLSGGWSGVGAKRAGS